MFMVLSPLRTLRLRLVRLKGLVTLNVFRGDKPYFDAVRSELVDAVRRLA
jgi:hypothetical protein